MLLSAERSVFLLVDAQTRLVPAIAGAEGAVRNLGRLATAAAALDVPSLATEQYPQGLGPTVPELAERFGPDRRVEKIHFSAVREPGFLDRLGERPQVVVGGFEAHVCVLQTAVDLIGLGRHVFVVADAVGSRTAESREVGLRRLEGAGARIVTTEMVIFEWLERAGTPVFRELSALIK